MRKRAKILTKRTYLHLRIDRPTKTLAERRAAKQQVTVSEYVRRLIERDATEAA